MSRFLTEILEDLEDECRVVMLHDSMELFRMLVHVEKVEHGDYNQH